MRYSSVFGSGDVCNSQELFLVHRAAFSYSITLGINPPRGNPNPVRTSQNDLPGALPIWKNPKSNCQSDKIMIQQADSFKMWKSVIGI
jgi:hypothetical protein